jgi:hypothetical protein
MNTGYAVAKEFALIEDRPPTINSIVKQGRVTWRVGAVMLTGGERYYMLVDVKHPNCVALLPWFDIEPWAKRWTTKTAANS